jgi:hypothetical protein
MSTTKFKYNQLNFIGKLFVKIFRLLHLLDIKENVGEGGMTSVLSCNGPVNISKWFILPVLLEVKWLVSSHVTVQ